jgi:ribulose-5-phosphate 4-epimerase/fuculose-1-phosphate aldolase
MILHEHSPESFQELIDAIMALGYDERTAGHYAVLVGDTPVRDEQGRIVVCENGRELARLNLKYFDD